MNFRHLHLNGGQRCERHLTFDAKILQKLWRLHPLAREVFKRGMIVSNSFCDLQSRQQSIAREPEIAENDVARRLAAKLAAAAKHLFKNEAITNRYSGQANAFVAKHPLQAEVGHQRTDNRWRIQLPNLHQPARHQQEDRVAVDEPAVCRHEHRPVAVSVVGDSEMRRSISHDRSQRIHVYGTQPALMLVPVGEACVTVTSEPNVRSNRGATSLMAPLAQSTTIRSPASHSPGGKCETRIS